MKSTQRACVREVLFLVIALLIMISATATTALADRLFLTGRDPDYHAIAGPNPIGSQHIIQTGINYIMDPSGNDFAAAGINKFLVIQGDITPPPGFLNGGPSLGLSGFTSDRYDIVSAAGLEAALAGLGTVYAGIVTMSDFGGLFSQAELDILVNHSSDIIGFLAAGGGLFAMGESGDRDTTMPGSHPITKDGLGDLGSPNAGKGNQFGFLPFVELAYCGNSYPQEVGSTLTAFGASLGLTTSDINGNYNHHCFADGSGLMAVDRDSTGHIVSLAGRLPEDVIPEPASLLLMATGFAAAARTLRKRGRG